MTSTSDRSADSGSARRHEDDLLVTADGTRAGSPRWLPPVGNIRTGPTKLAHNSRWYGLSPGGGIAKVGWGDLSYADLRRVEETIGSDIFIVLPEYPDGHARRRFVWRPYHEPDDRTPSRRRLADAAHLVVLAEGGLAYVDLRGTLGRRVTVRGLDVAIPTIRSADLETLLIGLVEAVAD